MLNLKPPKKIVTGLVLLVIANINLLAQTINFDALQKQFIDLGEVDRDNEDYSNYSPLKELLKDVEIVMLGEQSHGEATTYNTKIKLIKYLHEELGFDILAFESGFYDAHKAWELIEKGMNVREAMGHSISFIWSASKDLIPLAKYIEETKNKRTLQLIGFDSEFYTNLSKKYLLEDLTAYLLKRDGAILSASEWNHLKESLEYSFKNETKKLKRNHAELDTSYIDQLIQKLSQAPIDSETRFWIQTLKNIKIHILDYALGIDSRDNQMADNLKWIKEKYPNKKIICWGATSHFLYNSTMVRMKKLIIQFLYGKYYKKQPMMGHYVKELYGDRLFTIGFTAYQGHYGLDRNKKLKRAKKGTFEHLLSQSPYDNFLVPLKGWSFKDYKSRPLGNEYMKTDIAKVMDAVIFNRNMSPSRTDFDFYLMIYPENKYIRP